MAKRRPELVIDPAETRFRRHKLVGRNIVDYTPLDAYVFAKLINNRQFHAGDCLRKIWYRAGRAPKMTGDMQLVSHGRSEMSHGQARAWKALAIILEPLIPNHRALVHAVCCFEHGAESAAGNLGQPACTGLILLRSGLNVLSVSLGKTRQKYGNLISDALSEKS